MKVIKQNEGEKSRHIKVVLNDNKGITLTQLSMIGKVVYGIDEILCQKENTRELALSICPELADEIERLKEWKETSSLPEKDGDYLCRFIGWDDMEFYRVLEYDVNAEEWSDYTGLIYKPTHYQIINTLEQLKSK